MSCVQNRRPDYWTTSGAVENVLDLYFKHFKYSEKSMSLYSFFMLQEYESIIKGIIFSFINLIIIINQFIIIINHYKIRRIV